MTELEEGKQTIIAYTEGLLRQKGVQFAYSGEDDRLFRRNVTGDSAVSALLVFSTRIGHVQSRFR